MVVDGEGVSMGDEMRKMGENLTQLNKQYEAQLEGTRTFWKILRNTARWNVRIDVYAQFFSY